MTHQTENECPDSSASHTALMAITQQLRTASRAAIAANQADESGTDADSEREGTAEEEACQAKYAAYRTRYVAEGGDDNHQGWSCDLDGASDWWLGRPNATEAEWHAELATWGWISHEGEWHERS